MAFETDTLELQVDQGHVRLWISDMSPHECLFINMRWTGGTQVAAVLEKEHAKTLWCFLDAWLSRV